MKKVTKIVSFAICALLMTSAFAFDFGFLIDNDTTFKSIDNKELKLNQKDYVSAWVKTPLGKDYNNYFIAEGFYKFESNGFVDKQYNYLDLNCFEFVYSKKFEKSSFAVNAGRFRMVDRSGYVFLQNADGAFLSYSNKVMDVSVYGSYTGLLNGNIVKMINSPAFKGVDAKKVYDLADKNVVAAVSVAFPNLFVRQSVTLQGFGAYRLADKKFNRTYATLGLNGPIVASLFYDISGTVAFISNKSESAKIAPLVKGNIAYYFSNASIGVNAVFAGEDFKGISSKTAFNSMLEPEYESLLKTGLFVNIKPIKDLLVCASFDVGFDGKKNYELKGFQYNLGINYQIVSDVMVGLGCLQYFDNNKTDGDNKELSIKAKIAF